MNERITTESLEFVFKLRLNAILTTPTDFDPERESLPLIVFLHGADESGDDLELVKRHGISKLFTADPDCDRTRVITLSPQCPKGFGWRELILDRVFDMINDVARKYNADPDRISLTGVSMGGFGTFQLACKHPDFFSCIAPVCGGGDPKQAGVLKMPVWAFHGDNDNIVPQKFSKEMVDAINAAGGDAKLTVFENCGHASWVPAYEGSDALIRFLADTKRA